MDFFLNGQQVHQSFVDHAVGPMAFFEEQPAEGVFHGPGHLREHMGLHGGQMDDIRPDEPLRNPDSFGIDLVERQHLRFGLVVNPFLAFLVKVDIAQAVFVHDDLFVFIGDLAAPGADHNGPVVAAVKLVFAVAVLEKSRNDAVELPRRGGTGGIEVVPADIDLERGLSVPAAGIAGNRPAASDARNRQ